MWYGNKQASSNYRNTLQLFTGSLGSEEDGHFDFILVVAPNEILIQQRHHP